jgi:hypothetical protein
LVRDHLPRRGGQEINTGEAGIEERLRALERSFPHWQAHIPDSLAHSCRLADEVTAPALHLATSLRSFALSASGLRRPRDRGRRRGCATGQSGPGQLSALHHPRPGSGAALASPKRRGAERMGLLASSNAARLKPHGVFVKAKIEPAKWFLAPSDDVRSSDALEDAGTSSTSRV